MEQLITANDGAHWGGSRATHVGAAVGIHPPSHQADPPLFEQNELPRRLQRRWGPKSISRWFG